MNKQELINHIQRKKYPTVINEYERGYNHALNSAILCIYNIKNENDTSPAHYQGVIQPIDLINAQNLNFNLGNVVKYVSRAGKKQGESNLKDLEKAKDYINYEIKRLGEQQWQQWLYSYFHSAHSL